MVGSRLSFNISHSSSFVALASSMSDEVGVDLESLNSKKKYQILSKYCLHPKEVEDGIFSIQEEDILKAWAVNTHIKNQQVKTVNSIGNFSGNFSILSMMV